MKTPHFGFEFENAMRNIEIMLREEENKKDKIILLDFISQVIKEDLKTTLLSHIFYNPPGFKEDILTGVFPLYYYDEKGNYCKILCSGEKEIDLASDSVVVRYPWRLDRLQKCIKIIHKEGFEYHAHNHKAYYFPFIDLCYLYNGLHSSACGVVYRQGKIKADVYDLTELFPHVYTDGVNWYNLHNKSAIYKVEDFRFAILYEIGRKKHGLLTES